MSSKKNTIIYNLAEIDGERFIFSREENNKECEREVILNGRERKKLDPMKKVAYGRV